MNVITYQAPSNGGQINLTPAQIKRLEQAGKWPKNNWGQEYCTVSHGLHSGTPTYTAEELAAEVGLAAEAK